MTRPLQMEWLQREMHNNFWTNLFLVFLSPYTRLLQDGCFPGIQLPCPEMPTICRGTVSGLWFWKHAVTLSFTEQQSPSSRLRTKISNSNNCGSFDRDKAATSPLTAHLQHPLCKANKPLPFMTTRNNRLCAIIDRWTVRERGEEGTDRQMDGWKERDNCSGPFLAWCWILHSFSCMQSCWSLSLLVTSLVENGGSVLTAGLDNPDVCCLSF